MVQLTEFPLDVLSLIMLMLATSTDGAKHLARFAATCRLFRQHAKQYYVLKVVNFRHLISTDDYTRHHHPRDLLCVCAHNGNRAAKLIIAKAILYKDTWFKKMLEDSNQEALDFNVPYSGSGLLHSHELVRKFIRYGSNRDLLKMHNHLLSYVTAYVGYKVARAYGMYDAIKEMCNKLVIRIGEPRITLRSYDTLGNNVPVRVLSSRFRSDREKVLTVFDKLFPPSGPV